MKLINYSFLFFYVNIISTIFLFSSAIYSQQSPDSSSYYYYKIIKPIDNYDLPSGYAYFFKHKNEALLQKDTLRAIYDLRMIAISQLELGLIYESEYSVVEALSLLDNFKFNDSLNDSRIGLFNHLGRVYRSSNDLEKAIESFEKALKITTKTKDSISIINNIATIYTDFNEYDLALNHLNIAHIKSIKHGDKLKIARILNNIGFVQSKINSPDALDNLLKSLDIRKKEKDVYGMYQSYKNLVYYFTDRNKKTIALDYANKAYMITKKMNNDLYKLEALSLFIDFNDDPKVIEYKKLTDSIKKAKQERQNIFSSIKYDRDKEVKKTKAAKIETEKQKQWKIIYLGFGTVGLLGSIFLFFILKSRHQKRTLEQVNQTEARISEKIHDEVANDIYHVMTQLQQDNKPSGDLIDDLDSIYLKTRDISRANSALNVKKNFNILLQDLLSSYKSESISIMTRDISKINWSKISDIKKTVIYRVLQELMTNMRKHSQAFIVVLTFKQSSKKILITYSDNGIGCEIKKHNGLRNAENRIKNINGTINFESELNKGFKTIIKV